MKTVIDKNADSKYFNQSEKIPLSSDPHIRKKIKLKGIS